MRLNGDCASVTKLAQNIVLGFNTFALWSGVCLEQDKFLHFGAQQFGNESTKRLATFSIVPTSQRAYILEGPGAFIIHYR